jgi:3-hydroxybutyryl-CoA dehydrogenase
MERELPSVGVLGAGAMGSGIAQVLAAAGHDVVLADARRDAVARARDALAKSLARDVERGRLTIDAAEERIGRVRFCGLEGRSSDVVGLDLAAFADCGVVIEAIAEEIDAKREAFRDLEEVVGERCLLATNTSSLSVTAIAGGCHRAGRVVGLHFFNPAPVMPLVEIVPALQTLPDVVDECRRRWR